MGQTESLSKNQQLALTSKIRYYTGEVTRLAQGYKLEEELSKIELSSPRINQKGTTILHILDQWVQVMILLSSKTRDLSLKKSVTNTSRAIELIILKRCASQRLNAYHCKLIAQGRAAEQDKYNDFVPTLEKLIKTVKQIVHIIDEYSGLVE
jgi:hypothetical protein